VRPVGSRIESAMIEEVNIKFWLSEPPKRSFTPEPNSMASARLLSWLKK